MLGIFTLQAPITREGVVLSQPHNKTTPSSGLARMDSSTSILYRNLASMDVEESIRANPIDGVVLLCGCDKTTPSLVMGACSVNIPAIVVSGGPMLTGNYKGKKISISDVWRYSEEQRGGKIENDELRIIESSM